MHVNKGTLSGMRQFFATENPLEMMKNAFYFTLKALIIYKTFKFLYCFFSDLKKRLD